MRERPGFVKVQHAALEAALADLTPTQERVAWRLLADMGWEPQVKLVHGRAVELDVGEVLTGARRFAERLGLDRDTVRRALDRLEALGWVGLRPAFPATPQAAPLPAPQATPQAAPRAAPPPTIVRWLRHRDLLWPAAEAGPSTDPSGRPSSRAPAGQESPQAKNKTKTNPSASPRGVQGGGGSGSAPCRAEAAPAVAARVPRGLLRRADVEPALARGFGRGLTADDQAALGDMLGLDDLTVPEVERRARALAAEGEPTVRHLMSAWERLGQPPGAAGGGS